MLLTASLSVCAEFINIFIDKIVAARMLGENALAAISFFTPLFSIILFASSVVMVGSLVCYSIELGRMNKNKADRFFGQSIILSVTIGTLMVIAFAIGKRLLFNYMNVAPEQMQFVNEFYGWFLGLAFLIPLNNTLQEMVYVDGDTKTCNASYVALLLGNAILSCICGHYWGMTGIAFGTFISVILSTAVLSTHFIRKHNSLRFVWHFNMRDIASVIRFSMAEACEFLFFALFAAVMNMYFASSIGSSKFAILSLVYEIIELSVIFNGIWMAAEPLINIYRGEENNKGIVQTMRFVNWTIIKLSLITTAFLLFFAPLLTKIFSFESEETAIEAAFAIRACGIGILPLAIVKIYAAFHVHEKPFLSFLFIFLVSFACPLISVIAMNTFTGHEYVWLGFGIAPFLALGAGAACQLLFYGKEHFPLLLEHFSKENYWYTHDIDLTPKNLIHYLDNFGKLLDHRSVSNKSKLKAMLLIEELGMTIFESNKGKKVFLEVSIKMKKDDFFIVIKDDGKIMNLTDLEQSVTGLRMYFVNMFMTVQREKQYLLTSNYNRHVFHFEK